MGVISYSGCLLEAQHGDNREEGRKGHPPTHTPPLKNHLPAFVSPLFQLLFTFPQIMRRIPGPHRQIYKNYLKLATFVGERLEMNRQTLDPNNPRDFIDCFLIKIQQVSNSMAAPFPEESWEL